MRCTFFKTLTEIAEKEQRVVLLTGDLGYFLLEPFAEKFPDRFFNAGVAEQNMVGMATGLAEAGFIPFVYSIAPFVVLRPYEFIRNGPVLHRLPVRIVGGGGGFEYGANGNTHNMLEDIAVMRVLPGMTVIAPADFEQTRSSLMSTWNLPGPVYYRVGKDEKNIVAGLNGRFSLGHAEIVRKGSDVLLVTSGSISTEVEKAAELLSAQGVEASVAVVASLSPSPSDDLASMAAGFRLVVTIEAHYVSGGLGSLVAESIAEKGLGCRLVRCGVREQPDGMAGSQSYLYGRHGLSADSLAMTVRRELETR